MSMPFLKNNKLSFAKIFICSLVVAVGFQNCGKISLESLPAAKLNTALGTPSPASTSVDSSILKIDEAVGFVCSAFGSIVVPSEKSGLKTELRYLDQKNSSSIKDFNAIKSVDYFDDQNPHFLKAPETIYLSDVNVPTRSFTDGFTGSNGASLKDNNGNILIEYFGLKMESLLKLGPNDPEGNYELATLSDDGTVLQIKENGQWKTVINNDGSHSTQMGCMNHMISMTKDSRIPVRIFYNQGPRFMLANVLIWNYAGSSTTMSANGSGTHVFCGRGNNFDYWNGYSKSEPGTWLQELTTEGWKIVAPVNYQLPDDEVNPCSYSKYDVSPTITSEVVGNSQIIHFKSSDATVLSARILQVKDGQPKVVVKSLDKQDLDIAHDLDIGNLDSSANYELELTMELPAKQVKVLKVYKLSFVKKM